MDETFVDGNRPGIFGRGAAGKTLVAGAIERRGEGFGRARLQVIADASSASLSDFIRAHVSPGRHSPGMGGPPYPRAAAAIEVHNVKASSQPAHLSLPGVHLLFSLSKRILEGTYQGSVLPERLRGYLDELVFRFNRRNSQTRGLLFFRLLESAVAGAPAPYKPGRHPPHAKGRPVPPWTPHTLPRTLAGTPLKRPWPTP
ncbi:transposase [Arthrobacter alpinus]|uniref:transposase n=1 Tax=Arthrobacter alpinus TaxID=656366 RepID=UPI0009E6AFC8|nr:transposase [Arthrobacter alpinus]